MTTYQKKLFHSSFILSKLDELLVPSGTTIQDSKITVQGNEALSIPISTISVSLDPNLRPVSIPPSIKKLFK